MEEFKLGKTQISLLEDLINIPSPSGYTTHATKFVFDKLQDLGLRPTYTNKGAVTCALGRNPTLSIAAHVDTLGGIVSKLLPGGKVRFSTLGSLSLNSAEGEYVDVITHTKTKYRGTILLDNPSKHANAKLSDNKRSIENLHVRLDTLAKTEDDLRAEGINPGDIIALDPRFEHLENGFIKSRFLDNKAGCLVLLELARHCIAEEKEYPVELFFSNFEEVGHGAATGFSPSIEEMLVIDMGVLGDDCEGSETKCSICAKDSSGPYDYEMRKKLVDLAMAHDIPYAVDVYPFYGSDGSAALRAGNNFRVGLIGPGVAASHGNERTHTLGIEATIALCYQYITQGN